MSGTFKTEHVRLQVPDRTVAVDFYADAFGLATVAAVDGWTYLGCGYDENYDLAVREGPPGVEHVGVRLDDPGAFETYERRLAIAGVSTRRTDGAEPGQERGLRFTLPSGLDLELVAAADRSYKHYYETALPGRGGLAPLDLNHYNYHSPTVEADATLLRDTLDFRVSAVINNWRDGAFLRRGDMHHDVAVFRHRDGPADHASHHHTGFTVSSVDHMVRLLDRLSDRGTPLEFGIGRHFGGDNVFAYVRAPDGHRLELVCGMTELDDDTPIQFVEDVSRAVSAWHGEGLVVPDSWFAPSGLVR